MTAPGAAAAVVAGLLEARPRLRALPVEERARGLSMAAGAWCRRDAPDRQGIGQAMEAGTGYSRPVIDAGLDDLFSALAAEALLGWWRRSVAVEPADAPRLAIVLAAGNIPGVALFPMAACLLAGVPVLVRPATAEPHLIPAWVAGLARLAPDLGAAAAAFSWPSEESAVEAAVLDAAECILVFGRDSTIEALAARRPGRVLGYGTGVSFAVVGGEPARDPATALALARDVALWDQQGCLSPHGAYVLGGYSDVLRFARLLEEAMGAIQSELPRGRLTPAEAAQIRTTRAEVEAHTVAGHPGLCLTPAGGMEWTIVAGADPDFELSCLNRTVWIKPLEKLEDIPHLLSPWRRLLQGAGIMVSGSDQDRAEAALRQAGVGHVTRLGTLQSPPVDWPNKGRDLLQDILAPLAQGNDGIAGR